MPLRPPARSAVLALATLPLAAVLGLAGAAPAFADDTDFTTPSVEWLEADDDALAIQEANPGAADLFGTGVTALGWTNDALDGLFTDLTISYGGDERQYHTYWRDGSDFLLAPTSSAVDDAGLTLTSTASVDFGGGVVIDLALTLEIRGSYARWTLAFSGAPGATAEIQGNLGSDSDTVVHTTSTTAVVSSDGTAQRDPVIGMQIAGPDAAIAYDVDEVVASFAAEGTTTFTLALQDYAPCGVDVAIAEMVARVESLASSFGGVIQPAIVCGIEVAAPAELQAGTASDQTLAVTVDPLADELVQNELGQPSFLHLDVQDYGSYDLVQTRAAVAGLPAGTSLSFDRPTGSLRLTGTPTTVGDYEATVVFSVHLEEGGNVWDSNPVAARVSLRVAPAETVVDGAGDELVETGSGDGAGLLGAALLLGGIAVLGIARSRRRSA